MKTESPKISLDRLRKCGLLALRRPLSDVELWPPPAGLIDEDHENGAAPRCQLSQEKSAMKVAENGARCHRMTWCLWEQRKRDIPSGHLQAIRKGWDLSADQVTALMDWIGGPGSAADVPTP